MNALKQQAQQQYTLFDVIEQPVIIVSPDTRVVYANASAETLFKHDCAACLLSELLFVDGRAFQLSRQLLRRKQPVRAVFSNAKVKRYLDVYIRPHQQDGILVYVLSFVDVTAFVRREKALLEEASIDPLTRILNRRRFMDLFTKELNRADRLDDDIAVLMMDVDHFKRINDEHGHAAGDEVLKKITGIVQRELRDIDVFGRIGGEEFAIVLPGASLSKAGVVAERLRTLVREYPIRLGKQTVHVTISLGVAAERGKHASEDLLKQADKALYAAKHGGRDAVKPYTGSLSTTMESHFH